MIYLTITVLGNLALIVGPLPYDMAECETRKASIYASFEEAWNEGRIMKEGDHIIQKGDVEIACIERDDL